MVDINWDSVFQTSFAVALVLLPVLATYLGSQWANRRAFEREKKYDRKRESYETGISAVRRIWDASHDWYMLAEPLGQISAKDLERWYGALTPEREKDIRETMTFVAKFLALEMVSVKFEDGILTIPDAGSTDFPDVSELVQRETGKASLRLMRIIDRSGEELTRALSSLTLVDAPQSILTNLKRLEHPGKAGRGENQDAGTWLEMQLQAIEKEMKEDLQETISHRWFAGS